MKPSVPMGTFAVWCVTRIADDDFHLKVTLRHTTTATDVFVVVLAEQAPVIGSHVALSWVESEAPA